MTDPKGSENQSEELNLDELEGVAGGLSMTMPDVWDPSPACTFQPNSKMDATGGILRSNVSGSASPGGDDI